MSDVTTPPSSTESDSGVSADPVRAEPELPIPPATPAVAGPKVIELDMTPTALAAAGVATPPVIPPTDEDQTLTEQVKELLIGKPRDLADRSIYHSLSLVAFLAWVGLGADGLSSSCYGPAEAFHHLEGHTYLAVFLALATIATVFIISTCYSHIIEEFPSGGGGYLVASKLLGRPVGLVAGCALLVDYVLTVTVSIASAGDILFLMLPRVAQPWKVEVEFLAIGFLILLNLRGVKESVQVLLPIFLLFLVTHAVLIVGTVFTNFGRVGELFGEVGTGVQSDWKNPTVGFVGMLAMFLRAYSLGAGTYTGIEAVSNSMSVMREPRVATGRRTMTYMAISLALMAGGLVLCYLLVDIARLMEAAAPAAAEGPGGEAIAARMNRLLTEAFVAKLGLDGHWLGAVYLFATVISAGALLVVAAQAGFIGGPASLATMARDSWVPHWYGNLSERLATHNGVMLMGFSALAALVYTGGDVSTLLVMYSINVFVTFSLSMIGMCRHWWNERGENPLWRRRLALFATGAALCLAILGVTVVQKFYLGGWITLGVTGICVGLCFLINRYYRTVVVQLRRLNEILGELPIVGQPNLSEPDPSQPTAAILVGGYGGLGIHTLLNSIRFAPGYYKNVVFLSVGVLDSGNFKGARAVDDLRRHTQLSLERFVDLARANGFPAKGYMAIGPDAVDELENLCVAVAKLFPKATFFAGQLVFRKDTWYQRLLHNETAWSLQRRLQWAGLPMVILPTRVK
jgi:amino acid transporter